MRNFTFWIRWLQAVGWILVGFGLALAVFNQTWLFDVAFNQRIDPAFWPGTATTAEIQTYQAWIYGVLGATVAGWGVLIAVLARYPLRNRERWAWTGFLTAFALWFVVDTGLSARFGVYFNVAFNCALAVAVFLPLLAIRGDFSR